MHPVIPTNDLKRAIAKLPAKIRELCDAQIAILASDWRASRLHIKKLREGDGVYSFRITRNYRAQFYFDLSDNIIVFDADHRKDAYRKRRK